MTKYNVPAPLPLLACLVERAESSGLLDHIKTDCTDAHINASVLNLKILVVLVRRNLSWHEGGTGKHSYSTQGLVNFMIKKI